MITQLNNCLEDQKPTTETLGEINYNQTASPESAVARSEDGNRSYSAESSSAEAKSASATQSPRVPTISKIEPGLAGVSVLANTLLPTTASPENHLQTLQQAATAVAAVAASTANSPANLPTSNAASLSTMMPYTLAGAHSAQAHQYSMTPYHQLNTQQATSQDLYSSFVTDNPSHFSTGNNAFFVDVIGL